MKDLIKGVAKEKFEEFYDNEIYSSTHHLFGIDEFYQLPLKMQWGVIEDWAESEGYELDIFKKISSIKNTYEIVIRNENDADLWLEITKIKSRNEARTKCIKELVRLINESK